MSDNNVSDNGLSLSMSVVVNKQISEMILMPGNDAYSWHTKLMPVKILMHVMVHSIISIRACIL